MIKNIKEILCSYNRAYNPIYGKDKNFTREKENLCSFNGVYNQIYEETDNENKTSHSIITSNNKKEHTCVPWPWDNSNAKKKC